MHPPPIKAVDDYCTARLKTLLLFPLSVPNVRVKVPAVTLTELPRSKCPRTGLVDAVPVDAKIMGNWALNVEDVHVGVVVQRYSTCDPTGESDVPSDTEFAEEPSIRTPRAVYPVPEVFVVSVLAL